MYVLNGYLQASYDYSTTFGWNQIGTGTSIANGKVEYQNCPGQVSKRIYTQHQVNISNSWRLELDFIYSTTRKSNLSMGNQDNCSESWTSIPNANSDFYNPTVLNNITCFRRKTSLGTFVDYYSNVVTIIISENSSINEII